MNFADSNRLSQYQKAGLAFNTLVNHNVTKLFSLGWFTDENLSVYL